MFLPLAFVTLPAAYDRYKAVLPRNFQVGKMPLWVSLGLLGIGFVFAVLLAYHELRIQSDSTRRQLEAKLQQSGPKIILEYKRLTGVEVHRWYVTNSGNDDAVSVISDTITSSLATAKVERIQRVARGGDPVEVSFAQSSQGNPAGHHFHPTLLIASLIEELEASFTGVEFVERLGDLLIPVRLTYTDPAGNKFESHGQIHWNGVVKRGHYEALSRNRVV